MNKETIKELERNEVLRVLTVGKVARKENISFKEAERKLDAMVGLTKEASITQEEYEKALDAEFNCKRIELW